MRRSHAAFVAVALVGLLALSLWIATISADLKALRTEIERLRHLSGPTALEKAPSKGPVSNSAQPMPAASLTDFPETTTVAQGGSVSITGRVESEGYDGPIGVMATVRPCMVPEVFAAPIASTRLKGPGDFRLSVPLVYGKVYVCALALTDVSAVTKDPFEVTLYTQAGEVSLSEPTTDVGVLRLLRGPPVSLAPLFRSQKGQGPRPSGL